MPYSLNQKQRVSIQALDDYQRYDYFLKKVADWEEIWSLHSDEGWIELSSEDGELCLPIWPHLDFAKEWVNGEWSDCSPKAIKLKIWIERWTAGLQVDDTMLVIFPTAKGAGIVLSPDELENDILAELDIQA